MKIIIKDNCIDLGSVNGIRHHYGRKCNDFRHISPVGDYICYLGGKQYTQKENKATDGIEQI